MLTIFSGAVLIVGWLIGAAGRAWVKGLPERLWKHRRHEVLPPQPPPLPPPPAGVDRVYASRRARVTAHGRTSATVSAGSTVDFALGATPDGYSVTPEPKTDEPEGPAADV